MADDVGPFAQRAFIEAAMRASPDGAELAYHETDRAIVAFQVRPRALELAGHEDLVDYRSPRGDGAEDLIAREVDRCPAGTLLRFDSLPAAAKDVFVAALESASVDFVVADHTTTAVLDLPSSYDDYLGGLDKKERHEMRRKRRRYEQEVGPIAFRREAAPGPLLEAFVSNHRLAPGPKGEFMTEAMAAYFSELLTLPGWGIDALVDPDGDLAAAGFGYFDETGYYLYNSAFDPRYAHASPGVVMLGALIELNIERGSPVFDFLKGDESYKYRLGAHPRQLYRIEGST